MQFSYLQLNIWLGGKVWNPMVAYLKQENPDILALQEVYDGHDPALEKRFRTVEELKKELGYPYHTFQTASIDTRENCNIPWGNAIFTKFPITHSEAIFFDVPFGENQTGIEYAETAPRNMAHAVVACGGEEINVFSLHGIWGHDGEDNARRIAMSNTILEHVCNKKHTVLSGDFNVREKTRTIEILEEKLVSVFKNELETTRNMRQCNNPKFTHSVIDFIFASRDLSVVSHRCSDADVSDHVPLAATFEL